MKILTFKGGPKIWSHENIVKSKGGMKILTFKGGGQKIRSHENIVKSKGGMKIFTFQEGPTYKES